MARFRSGTLPGKVEGGYPGHDDLLSHECQKDGQTVTDQKGGGRIT